MIWFLLILVSASSCAFNIEVTSQKTAMEKQIMGSYQKLDDDVILVSSVRSLDKSGQKKTADLTSRQEVAVKAKQNQDFNRDDIDELKNASVIGETWDGRIAMVPAETLHLTVPNAEQVSLAKRLLEEENRDRAAIWHRVIEMNESLSEKNLGDVQATFAKTQIAKEPKGHWIETANGQWEQKK